MSVEDDIPFGSAETGDGEAPLNRRECPHCGLWFRLDEAKAVGDHMVRCPYCDWLLEED